LNKPTCAICDAELKDGARICTRCGAKLERALGDIAAIDTRDVTIDKHIGVPRHRFRRSLVAELELTRSRQGRGGQLTSGRSGGHSPLPFDPRASEARDELVNALTTWARVVVEHHDDFTGDGSATNVSRWLLRKVEFIRHQEWADECYRDILAAVRRAQHVIDRGRGDQFYTGPCRALLPDGTDCETEIYYSDDARTVTCPSCGFLWWVSDRREWMLLCADEQWLYAHRIADVLTVLGLPVTESAIRGYAHRGRLQARSIDDAGRPFYRVGDVIDIVRAISGEKKRREDARAKRPRRISA
jgi:hypothetical protein